ncbi:hypothetical protein CEXT_507261 [Caerostris extrusa]|uniref:Ycf1 n=1 Tax=Caerostris extrusa TaxID=172846 RepID=A0AAV4M8P4_CAEEX|nr:hypothetical protein CEXT_507261 [Caerostris extrusa]
MQDSSPRNFFFQGKYLQCTYWLSELLQTRQRKSRYSIKVNGVGKKQEDLIPAEIFGGEDNPSEEKEDFRNSPRAIPTGNQPDVLRNCIA